MSTNRINNCGTSKQWNITYCYIQHGWISRHSVKQKQPDPKECTQSDAIYILLHETQTDKAYQGR